MAVRIEISSQGFAQVEKVMKGLPSQLQRKVLVSAGREAAKPLVRDIRSGLSSVAGDVSGETRKSIGVKALRSRNKFNAAVFVGARGGKRYKGYRALFIEGGTKERKARGNGMLRFTTKDGREVFAKKVAAIPAQPFIGPAIERNVNGIRRDMATSLGRALDRYMRRIIKKNAR